MTTGIMDHISDDCIYGVVDLLGEGSGDEQEFSMTSVREALFFSADNEKGKKKKYKAGDVVVVNLFREGRFEHAVYGSLNFTPQYLESLVYNFDRGVCQQKLAGNIDHDTKFGALGWIEKQPGNLFIEARNIQTGTGEVSRRMLFGRVTLTDFGAKQYNGKGYRYISAEVHPNYSNGEVYSFSRDPHQDLGGFQFASKVVNPDNEDEYMITFGPTLTGWAHTNDPYISGLIQSFTAGSDSGVQGFDVSNLEFTSADETGEAMFFCRKATKTEEDGQNFDDSTENGNGIANEVDASTEINTANVAGRQFTDAAQKEQGGAMSFTQKFTNEISAATTYDEKAEICRRWSFSAKDEADRIFAADQEQVFTELAAAKRENDRLGSDLAAAKTAREEAEEKVKFTSDQNAAYAEKLAAFRKSAVESKASQVYTSLKSMNFPIASCEYARDLVSGLSVEQYDQKFTGKSEDGKDVQVGIADVLLAFAGTLPEQFTAAGATGALLDSEPATEVNDEGEGNGDEDLSPNVQLYVAKYGRDNQVFQTPSLHRFIDEKGEFDHSCGLNK